MPHPGSQLYKTLALPVLGMISEYYSEIKLQIQSTAKIK